MIEIDRVIAITKEQAEILDKTRKPCLRCEGSGKLEIPADGRPTGLLVPCDKCYGTGKGEWDLDRLAVLDDDQTLPEGVGECMDCLDSYKMLKANWKKVVK